MTNMERYPEAFDAQGIPKVGGKWKHKDGSGWTVLRQEDAGWFRVLGIHGESNAGLQWFRDDAGSFLGFSDSAPVNQGAAAPQKPAFKKGERVRLVKADGFGAQRGAPATVVEDYDPNGYLQLVWDDGPLRGGQDNGRYFPDHFERIGSSTPIVAPPPSLKAAVQQEGLSIPPQAGVRHEQYERMAQASERDAATEDGTKEEIDGWMRGAKDNMQKARAALPFDLAYDLEADAIRSNRVVRKAALKEMGQGDRRCFDLRGLSEFEAIRSAEHALYFWWRK